MSYRLVPAAAESFTVAKANSKETLRGRAGAFTIIITSLKRFIGQMIKNGPPLFCTGQITIKDPQRYAVHECDATMLNQGSFAGTKKFYETQELLIYIFGSKCCNALCFFTNRYE